MTIHSKLAEIKERCKEAAKYDSYAPLNVAADVETLTEVIECLTEALEFECGNKCNREHNPCNAYEALTKAQEILERVR